MNNKNIQEKMAVLQKEIFDNDYYVELYYDVIESYGLFRDTILVADDQTIIEICNTFWTHLPDSDAIRREPFFKLCDIAEHIFDESLDPTDDA